MTGHICVLPTKVRISLLHPLKQTSMQRGKNNLQHDTIVILYWYWFQKYEILVLVWISEQHIENKYICFGQTNTNIRTTFRKQFGKNGPGKNTSDFWGQLFGKSRKIGPKKNTSDFWGLGHGHGLGHGPWPIPIQRPIRIYYILVLVPASG